MMLLALSAFPGSVTFRLAVTISGTPRAWTRSM
jgi:hypothetical protein